MNGPAPDINPRFARIEIFETIAIVHLEVQGWSGKLAGADASIAEVFTLLKREGQWLITQKTFHGMTRSLCHSEVGEGGSLKSPSYWSVYRLAAARSLRNSSAVSTWAVARRIALNAPSFAQRPGIHGVETELVEQIGHDCLRVGIVAGNHQRGGGPIPPAARGWSAPPRRYG